MVSWSFLLLGKADDTPCSEWGNMVRKLNKQKKVNNYESYVEVCVSF